MEDIVWKKMYLFMEIFLKLFRVYLFMDDSLANNVPFDCIMFH